MSEQQVETLSAAAAKEQARSAHQGLVRSWHLSKDGSQIAMRQEHPPLREFDVAEALGKSAHTHWSEAAELQLGAPGAVREAVLASSPVMAAVPSITAESAIRLA